MHDIAVMAEAQYGVPAAEWEGGYERYYEYKGQLRFYDMSKHLGAIAIDLNDFRGNVAELAIENDYLYDDVRPFLESLPHDVEPFVLTFGTKWTQMLKLATSGLGIRSRIMMDPKGIWLQHWYGDRQGMMIDDKEVHDLPPGFTMQLIDRTGDGTAVPNTLKDIQIKP